MSVRMSSSHATLSSPITEPIPSDPTSAALPVVRSALWAAWGDALGFPAELADQELVQRRLDGQPDGRLHPWRRRIGGRMGPIVQLPAGCTSDDTQLRLAVGRCVRVSGRFDAEAFSKIELPVFLSYQLGAGRGTKAAAQSLGRRSTRWFSNFFEARGSRYVDGGGNGAAMRIQPHVWAAGDGRPDTYLAPMLRDALCTHGHPRGVLGAALHAVALGTTLRQGTVPEPDRWLGMVRFLERIAKLVRQDDTLSERWLPVWESNAGRPWAEAISDGLHELEEQLAAAARAAQTVARDQRENAYAELARDLGGLNPKTRGAGTTTAVMSLWIAYTHQDDPVGGTRLAAKLLGSDTDTIATMAGALLGAVATEDPPEPVMDAELIAREAARLAALGAGRRVESFPHPDPLRWQPPRNLSNAVGLIDGRPAIAGLGLAWQDGPPIQGEGKDAGVWQWLVTEYGQRLLIKRRHELDELPENARPRRRPASTMEPADSGEQRRLFVSHSRSDSEFPSDPEAGVLLLASNAFDDTLMAQLLRHYGHQSSIAAATFAALLSERLREARGRRTADNGTGGSAQSHTEAEERN
jgi:ADP-ribosylglycohydrolase